MPLASCTPARPWCAAAAAAAGWLPCCVTECVASHAVGKLREARLLCCQAGQAWRCMSLAGGGEWGPLPVGAAAAEAAEQIDQQVGWMRMLRSGRL